MFFSLTRVVVRLQKFGLRRRLDLAPLRLLLKGRAEPAAKTMPRTTVKIQEQPPLPAYTRERERNVFRPETMKEPATVETAKGAPVRRSWTFSYAIAIVRLVPAAPTLRDGLAAHSFAAPGRTAPQSSAVRNPELRHVHSLPQRPNASIDLNGNTFEATNKAVSERTCQGRRLGQGGPTGTRRTILK